MRSGALALLVAVVALLAGCGGGSSSNGEAKKPAAQVLADAQQAAGSASTVHVSGHIVSGGTPLSLDLTLVRGKGGRGTLSENGLSFDLVRIGDKAYIRGSDAFYRKFAGSAAAQLLHGKWLEGSAKTGDLATLGSVTSVDALMNQLAHSHGRLVNEGETTFEGKKVDSIRDTRKGGRLYVAATGKPYPVAIVGGKGEQGTVRFDKWNEAATLSTPKGAVDLSQLGG